MKDLRSQNWDLEYIEQHFLAKVAKKINNSIDKYTKILIYTWAVIANHCHLKEIANYLKDFEREKEAMRKEAIMEMTSKVSFSHTNTNTNNWTIPRSKSAKYLFETNWI